LDRRFAWDTAFAAGIATLTPQQIQSALQRYLDPNKLSIVKAGDFTHVAEGSVGAESKN
jgi:zinc protease